MGTSDRRHPTSGRFYYIKLHDCISKIMEKVDIQSHGKSQGMQIYWGSSEEKGDLLKREKVGVRCL